MDRSGNRDLPALAFVLRILEAAPSAGNVRVLRRQGAVAHEPQIEKPTRLLPSGLRIVAGAFA
jgi:hypothetical protein